MRAAMIHGILLAVMLVYGYRTWTRDKTDTTNVGTVVLWDKSEADLVSIEYKAPKKIVKLEKKGDGYWGADTTIDMKPKAKPPGEGSGSAGSAGSAGSGSGSGSGAGSGSAAAKPVEEEEVGRKTKEFPYGEKDDKIIKDWTAARALRDLGVPNDEQKKDFKLVDAKTTITVTFKDGPKTFLLGGPVYGGSDRYAVDQANGRAYVLSKDLVANLESGEPMLHLVDPRGFDVTKIDRITIDAGGKSKSIVHVETEQDGTKHKVWADVETNATNTLAANFVDSVANLRPSEYNTTVKPSDMQVVLKLTYKTDKGVLLGTLQLLRYEKPGALVEGQELDPANPPKGETEYYVLTEKSRVPGLVRKDQAQRTENDIENVFSGKTEAGSGAGSGHSIDPHGNPLGPVPGHGMGSASPGMTPGLTPAPPALGSGAASGSAPPALKPVPPPAPGMSGSAAPAPKPVTPPAPKPVAPTPAPAAPATGSAAH